MNSAVKVHRAAIRAADRRRAIWLVQSKERHQREASTPKRKDCSDESQSD